MSLLVLWIVLLFLLFLLPLGVGYRSWGVPYPSYYARRRRTYRADIGPDTPESSGWGIFADILWIVLLTLLAFMVIALFA